VIAAAVSGHGGQQPTYSSSRDARVADEYKLINRRLMARPQPSTRSSVVSTAMDGGCREARWAKGVRSPWGTWVAHLTLRAI